MKELFTLFIFSFVVFFEKVNSLFYCFFCVCVCFWLFLWTFLLFFFFCEIFPMRINSNGARFRWDSTQELLWQRDLVDVTVIMGKGKRGGAEHLIHRHQLRTRLRGGGKELNWNESNQIMQKEEEVVEEDLFKTTGEEEVIRISGN